VKLGHRAAGLLPNLKGRLSKRFVRQDGAVAVEMVLVSMLLIPLVCGLLDFGMLWQKNQSAESAVRQGARRAAANCLESLNDPAATCKNGSQEEDDADVLLSIISALGTAEEVQKVVVFNANLSSVSDLNGSAPPGCMEATPPMGIDDQCNVYGPAELEDITTLNTAAIKARFNCAGGASASWCPTNRTRSAATPTYIGVAIIVRHQHITGMFGSSAPVKTQAIFRLEPNTYSPVAVYAPDAVFEAVTSTTTTTTTSTSTTTTIAPEFDCPAGGGFMTVAECVAITPTTIPPSTTTTLEPTYPCPYTAMPVTAAACIAATPTTIAPSTTTTLEPTYPCPYTAMPVTAAACVAATPTTVAPSTTTTIAPSTTTTTRAPRPRGQPL
jgi:hypothetical protein